MCAITIFLFPMKKIVKILPDSSNSVLDIIEGVRSMSYKLSYPPSYTKVLFELRERHGFFVHFQAVPFPDVRVSFIVRCSIETPFTMAAEMLSGEPELRFRFCQKHL